MKNETDTYSIETSSEFNPDDRSNAHIRTHNTLRGADLLVRTLEEVGVEYVFGYPGGAIMPVYDALTNSRLTHILARHEQGAAFMAEGYARVSGKVGVCLATSGPGLTNLVTGIADAFADSVPMVAIVGQVPAQLMGTDAFQEVDGIGITMPIVKHSYVIRHTKDIPKIIWEAVTIATSGRPGPVVIELPKDIGTAEITDNSYTPPLSVVAMGDDETSICRAREIIESSQKPLLYVGGGVVIAGAVEALRDFVSRTNIPVVATLKGLGAIPTDDDNFIGMLGMHGLKAANYAVQDCDLLIALGARFDHRVTGKLDDFAPNATIIHMDIDAGEINKLRKADHAMTGAMAENLWAIKPENLNIDEWRRDIFVKKERYRFQYPEGKSTEPQGIYAPKLLKELSEIVDEKAIFTCDVGQHQMWVAQHCRFMRPQAHLTSGGLGAMGFGMPAGIGAKIAEPESTVITITGDGSIMMNIQELATLNRYGINLKIVLLDNSSLGMVRQWQTLFYKGNYSEIDLSDNPDFAEVARAFGIKAFTISKADEVSGALEKLLKIPGPCLIHVKIDPKENVWPLVPPGADIANMIEELPCQTS